MAKCSAFVSASDYEGFGLVLVEAHVGGPLAGRQPDSDFFRIWSKKTDLGTIVDFDDPDAAAHKFLAHWSLHIRQTIR